MGPDQRGDRVAVGGRPGEQGTQAAGEWQFALGWKRATQGGAVSGVDVHLGHLLTPALGRREPATGSRARESGRSALL